MRASEAGPLWGAALRSSRPHSGPASRSDPGRSGSRGACAALPGVRASEWQTPVRRRLGHRAVGAERCALPGRRVSSHRPRAQGRVCGRAPGGAAVALTWSRAPRAEGKVQVLLGAHSLSQPEPSKRLYDVRLAVPHPDSRPDTIDHDLLLLQVGAGQPRSLLLRWDGVPPRSDPLPHPTLVTFSPVALNPHSAARPRRGLAAASRFPPARGPDVHLCPIPAIGEGGTRPGRTASGPAARGPRRGARHTLRRGRLGRGQPRWPPA